MVENFPEDQSVFLSSSTKANQAENYGPTKPVQLPSGWKMSKRKEDSRSATDWKAGIEEQMQRELEEKVRAVLKTPPIERLRRIREQNRIEKAAPPDILQFNDQLLQNWNKAEKSFYRQTSRVQSAIKKQRLIPSFIHSAPPLYQPFIRNEFYELDFQQISSRENGVFTRPDPRSLYNERHFLHLEKEIFCKRQHELGFFWPDCLGPLLPSVKFQNEVTSPIEPLAQYLSGPKENASERNRETNRRNATQSSCPIHSAEKYR